jgi:maltooligosyltrehalose trehalohydrolase
VGLDGSHFVAYLQNHDQIGNRAFGERSSQLMSPGRLKIAAALILGSPFVPMLFQGEEWGASSPFLFFSDHRDPELAAAVSEGRRRECATIGGDAGEPPDPQAPATFERSKLPWDELSEPRHAELLEWHQRLIRIRRSNASLHDGRLEDVRAGCDEHQRWLTLDRGAWSIVCNLGRTSTTTRLRDGVYTLVAGSEAGITVMGSTVTLPPDSVAILSLGQDERAVHSQNSC